MPSGCSLPPRVPIATLPQKTTPHPHPPPPPSGSSGQLGGTTGSMHPTMPTLHSPSQGAGDLPPPVRVPRLSHPHMAPHGWQPPWWGHDSPLHIHGGEGEGHPFEQQHHEEPLAEGAVAHALPILACLWADRESSAAQQGQHSQAALVGVGRGWQGTCHPPPGQAQAGHGPASTAGSLRHPLCWAGHQPLPAPGASMPHPRAAYVAQQVLALAPLGDQGAPGCPSPGMPSGPGRGGSDHSGTRGSCGRGQPQA